LWTGLFQRLLLIELLELIALIESDPRRRLSPMQRAHEMMTTPCGDDIVLPLPHTPPELLNPTRHTTHQTSLLVYSIPGLLVHFIISQPTPSHPCCCQDSTLEARNSRLESRLLSMRLSQRINGCALGADRNGGPCVCFSLAGGLPRYRWRTFGQPSVHLLRLPNYPCRSMSTGARIGQSARASRGSANATPLYSAKIVPVSISNTSRSKHLARVLRVRLITRHTPR
jgi:hypothetical protein